MPSKLNAKLTQNTEKMQELEGQRDAFCVQKNALRRKLVQLQGEKRQLAKENRTLKLIVHKHGLTPQKPFRGLSSVPTNRPPPIPASKREVPAKMVHLGRNSDSARQEAEGVKRSNSSTLLP